MKIGKLFFALAFLMLFADASMAAKWKAKHVVLIGLDGWGAYSVEKAECEEADGRRILYVEKTLCPSIFQCRELGFHVYGGRTGTSRLYGMGVANPGTSFPRGE